MTKLFPVSALDPDTLNAAVEHIYETPRCASAGTCKHFKPAWVESNFVSAGEDSYSTHHPPSCKQAWWSKRCAENCPRNDPRLELKKRTEYAVKVRDSYRTHLAEAEESVHDLAHISDFIKGRKP